MKPIQRVLAAAALLAISSAASANLVFNFSFTPTTSAQEQQAFLAAGARWSNLFTDNVTVDMTVGTAAMGPGILAAAESREMTVSYSAFYAALNADKRSASDNTAVASLGSGPSFSMLINQTSDNPNGSGSATPYVDSVGANNETIRLNIANAKALGLAVNTGTLTDCVAVCDASIIFSTGFSFDLNPLDGINAGQFDFVGIAAHEIGHALGFVSGVDFLDFLGGGQAPADDFTYVNSLDLFRYSGGSRAAGVIDFTADSRDKYFSIDGGLTAIAGFSTGEALGDGSQASHWKNNLGLGLMDPTSGFGELLAFAANDIQAFDVIGWDLASASNNTPEPSALALVGMGLLGLVVSRRRRARAV